MMACLNWRALLVSTRAYDAAVGRGLGTVPASRVIGKRANGAVAKATGPASARREHCATTRWSRPRSSFDAVVSDEVRIAACCELVAKELTRRRPFSDHAIATAPQMGDALSVRARRASRLAMPKV